MQEIVHHSELEDLLFAPSNNHQRRTNEIIVKECLDATKWFSTRDTEGVNLLATYYDCQCAGDFSLYFSIECTLQDYCFMDLADDTTERCINHNVTYDFSVDQDTGAIDNIQRGFICIDFLKGRPIGQLCRVDSNVCALLMRDVHNYSTESASELCGNATLCHEALPTLGYSSDEELQRLCPTTTLNDIECNDFGLEQRCGELSDDSVFTITTPDCSNVESCASQSCQVRPRVNPTPARNILVFPECNSSRVEDPPTSSPDASNAEIIESQTTVVLLVAMLLITLVEI